MVEEKPTGKGQDFERVLDKSDRSIASFETQHKTITDRVQHFLHSYPTMVPVIVLFLSVIAFGFISGEKFFSPFNLSLIMQQVSIIGILAAAQSLIILTAGIDLSVAAIMVLMSVIMGNLAVNLGVPSFFAILIGFTSTLSPTPGSAIGGLHPETEAECGKPCGLSSTGGPQGRGPTSSAT